MYKNYIFIYSGNDFIDGEWHWKNIPYSDLIMFKVSHDSIELIKLFQMIRCLILNPKHKVIVHSNSINIYILILAKYFLCIKNIFIYAEFNINLNRSSDFFRSILKKYFLSFFIRNLDAVICFSKTHMEELKLISGTNNIHVISEPLFYGDNLGKMPDYLFKKRDVVLFAGRTNRNIDLTKKLISKINKNQILLVGDAFSEINSFDNVKNLGDVNYEDLCKIMINSRALVIPLNDVKNNSGIRMLGMAFKFGVPVIISRNQEIENRFGDVVIYLDEIKNDPEKILNDEILLSNYSVKGFVFLKNHGLSKSYSEEFIKRLNEL